MGKMKRKRQRLHAAAAKPSDVASTNNEPRIGTCSSMLSDCLPPALLQTHQSDHTLSKAPSLLNGSGGVFSKLNIDMDALTKRLTGHLDGTEFDARSAVTSKSLRGLNLTKKDKLKLRHDIWLKKVDIIEENLKEERAKRKRKRTAVVGDMRPLHDSLLESLPILRLAPPHCLPPLAATSSLSQKSRSTSGAETSQTIKKTGEATKRKARTIEKESYQKKQMLEDIKTYNAVLKHPAYVENPFGTILEHLKNKMEEQNKKH